jgi:hypothetical protein
MENMRGQDGKSNCPAHAKSVFQSGTPGLSTAAEKAGAKIKPAG